MGNYTTASALLSRLQPAALPPPAPSHTGTTLAQQQPEHLNSRLPSSRLPKLSSPCRFPVPAGNRSKDNWYFALVSLRLYLKKFVYPNSQQMSVRIRKCCASRHGLVKQLAWKHNGSLAAKKTTEVLTFNFLALSSASFLHYHPSGI